MQVKKDSKHFLLACIILYFYTKGYCLLFWLRHILLYRTATHAKAASPLCFKADSGHFSFTSSFPHFSCRIETATSIRRTRLLPDLCPIIFPTMQRIWLLNGISFLPLHPQTADTLSRLMFFPPTCRNGSGLVSVDGQVFHVSESAADCFASTFSRPLSI